MSALWDLLRGGAALARPRAAELSVRLSELLVSGAGQPGHRDLLLSVHDLDARRDLVFGMIGGASIAFMTSVWGVFTSVMFNFFEKIFFDLGFVLIYLNFHENGFFQNT